MEHKTFNTFDKVLVCNDRGQWRIDLYESWDRLNNKHNCLKHRNVADVNIRPYEGNAKMLEDNLWISVGTYCAGSDFSADLRGGEVYVGKFNGIDNGMILLCNNDVITKHKYCIPLSLMDPSDPEKMRKSVVRVEGDRLVKI